MDDAKQSAENEKQAAEKEKLARKEADKQRENAQEQADRALAGSLAAQADSIKNSDHVLALLLGLEAYDREQNLLTRTTLFNLLQFTPYKRTFGFMGSVTSAAVSPDGKWIVSGSEDKTVRVWEAATGRVVARMAHDDLVRYVAFSPDGKWVVSASNDKSVRVWLWRSEDILVEACARLPRNLTHLEWEQFVSKEIPYHVTCSNLPAPNN